MTAHEPVRLDRRGILQRAKAAGVSGEQALKDVMFHQLLARINASAPDTFVLKGAQALQLRGVTRRATMDIDLAARLDLESALASIRAALAIDLADGLLYEERAAPRALLGDAIGAGQGVRLSLEVVLDGIALAIGLDLVVDLRRQAEGLRLPRTTLVRVPGTAPVDFAVYDLAEHVADKISATLATYGDGRASSRTKDLYDICAIALTSSVNGTDAVAALRRQIAARGIDTPSEFSVPASMERGWSRFIAGLQDDTPVPVGFGSAVDLARSLAEPLVTGDAAGLTWNHAESRWSPTEA